MGRQSAHAVAAVGGRVLCVDVDAARAHAVAKEVDALHLQDATLAIYAKNYQATLVVLSKTLELKAGSSAPDGTDAVVQLNLKAARTDADDVQRYCAP